MRSKIIKKQARLEWGEGRTRKSAEREIHEEKE